MARPWWNSLLLEPPGEDLAGLWFGIFDGRTQAGSGRQLYVAGTATFDADDSTGDWAADEYVWQPQKRYLVLPRLRRLPKEPVDVPLAHTVAVIRALAPWQDLPGLGVAVGYDDGDFEVLSRG